MRRKCHLIIIQIDLIWVISFWEQGSFGISLVYWHLHVLIEFLLVFNLPFLSYNWKRVFGENQGLGCVAENFLGFILDLLCGLLFVDPDPRCSSAGGCFPREQTPLSEPLSKGKMSQCHCNGMWCSSHLGFLPSLCPSPVPQGSPSWSVLLCENWGRNPARKKCLNHTWTWIMFLSLAAVEGSLFSRLWCDGVTPALLGTGILGPRGFLGVCLEPPPRGDGSPAVVCSSMLWAWQGFLKPPNSCHHTDSWIRYRVAAWTVITVHILWLCCHKIPALGYCPCTDRHWPKPVSLPWWPLMELPWVTPPSHSLIYK